MRPIKLAIMIGGAAYLLSSTGLSLAQSADIDADLRCAAVSLMVNNTNNDPKVREASQLMLAYFTGKLIGRDPNLNVKSGLGSAIDKFMQRKSVAEMEQELERCAKDMITVKKRFDSAIQ